MKETQGGEGLTVENTVRIENRYGLHGRPTTLFVKVAKRFSSEIRVSRDGDPEEVDGKSAIGLLSLGMEHGCTLRIRADGADAREAIFALTELVRNKFAEE